MDNFASLLQFAKDSQGRGDYSRAEGGYRRALALDPSQAHVWYLLGTVCHAQGKNALAVESFRQAIVLRPEFAHSHYHLGIVLGQMGNQAEAETEYRQALVLKPDLGDALGRLGEAVAAQGRLDEAEQILREAVAMLPRHAPVQIALHLYLASTLFRRNREAEAEEVFRQAARLSPGAAEVQSAWASALLGLGKTREAIDHLHEALRLDPDHALAYGHLGELVREGAYTFSPAEIDSLHRLLSAAHAPPADRVLLEFALGHSDDRQGQYAQAFAHYHRANTQQHELNLRAGSATDASYTRRLVDDLVTAFTPEFFKLRAGYGHSSEKPLFIVGMPRSGTTLTDQILSAHPEVASGGELMEMQKLVSGLPRMLEQPRTLELLSRLDRDTVAKMTETYLRGLDRIGGPSAQRVTDKMPQNYFYLGFIAMMFPRARIVHCRRDPMDVCLSCYTHNFADFSTSLEMLGLYYRQYERLMDHWHQVLPVPIHEIQYEELVSRPEAVVGELLSFCGLPWSELCLAHHQKPGPVHTASRLQVRRPIYTTAVARWKRYEAHLEPLVRALS